ncbi:MAG: Nif11-like leader peptide family natural product precursor [Acidobacteria bacterium]|nr:Nif11-like leader peptide family natural product precursor [Acidobacteriota bacterium]
MSVASAQGFLEKVKTDAAFAKAVRGAATSQERTALVSAAGFDFTQKELDQARQGELSEQELESVAGGGYLCVTDNNCMQK